MNRSALTRMTTLAMLTALAFLIAALVRIPLIPSMGFLKYDAKDVILVIAGLLFGPAAALLATVCTALLEMVTVSSTGMIGFVMNTLASLSFALPPALLYKRNRSLRAALQGLVLGVVLMTAVMLLWNYVLTPLFTGWPREKVVALLVPAILPFNLIKGGINLALTLLLYNPLSRALRKAGVHPVQEARTVRRQERTFYRAVMCFAAFLLLTLVLVLLAWRGVF